MAHFAKVENGIVTQVIVAEQSFINTGAVGDPSLWIQTSYNTRGGVHYDNEGNPDGKTPLRANFAGLGFNYDAENDVFYRQRPRDKDGLLCESWTIGAPDWMWTPPTPNPSSGQDVYLWDETNLQWVLAPKD